MSTTFTQGLTIVAGEALLGARLVKFGGLYCDAGDTPIGVTIGEFALADHATLKLLTDSGTFKMTAAGAIAAGARVYTAADGKISAKPYGKSLGIAVNAATADGDMIEVLSIADDGVLGGLTYEAVADNLTLDAQDVGKLLAVTVDAKAITLPATAAGLRYVIVNGSAATGTCIVTVSPNALDKIMGPDLAGEDNKDWINTKATAVPGDYVILQADGAAGWYIVGQKGIWVSE